MSSFKPGDVVKLKTGSPLMTVEYIMEGQSKGDFVAALVYWCQETLSLVKTSVRVNALVPALASDIINEE